MTASPPSFSCTSATNPYRFLQLIPTSSTSSAKYHLGTSSEFKFSLSTLPPAASSETTYRVDHHPRKTSTSCSSGNVFLQCISTHTYHHLPSPDKTLLDNYPLLRFLLRTAPPATNSETIYFDALLTPPEKTLPDTCGEFQQFPIIPLLLRKDTTNSYSEF